MAIKINDSYKPKFSAAASSLSRRALRIEEWRHNHHEPSDADMGELKDIYHSISEAKQDLKYAVEGYFGINLD